MQEQSYRSIALRLSRDMMSMESHIPIVPNYTKGRQIEDWILESIPELEQARQENNYRAWINAGFEMLLSNILGPWSEFCELLYEKNLQTLKTDGFDAKGYIDTIEDSYCIVAHYATRPYDVEYSSTVTKTRTVAVKVPKERKIGFFKTETYYDTEKRSENYTEQVPIRYKGWVIERLAIRFEHIVYGYAPSIKKNTLHIDYCLGSDGKIYTITYIEDTTTWEPLIREYTHLSPLDYANKSLNVLAQVLAGSIAALDCIPSGEADHKSVLKFTAEMYEKSWMLNFPKQVNDISECPFGGYEGALTRMLRGNFLDESAKEECILKHPHLSAFL